jgi:glutamine amidotransferase PdxT
MPLDFSRKLSRIIALTGGPRTRLVTLQDAAVLIGNLEQFRQARPIWDRAAEMILLAAKTGRPDDIQEATRQMLTAVIFENWWKSS